MKAAGEENPKPSIEDTSKKMLMEETEIFKKFDIPWKPAEDQVSAVDKLANSDKETCRGLSSSTNTR